MSSAHRFTISLNWTGNRGSGTSGYRDYDRCHELSRPGKQLIAGSSDPVFHGDGTRYNPEELFVGALSSCHMLWYLHLSAVAGVVVERYCDDAEGTMQVEANGGGRFTEVMLRPRCSYKGRVDPAVVRRLHEESHTRCFVANSVNCPVRVEPADDAPISVTSPTAPAA
jgi:organic hydroperoxide reductase OsmC/OhrA